MITWKCKFCKKEHIYNGGVKYCECCDLGKRNKNILKKQKEMTPREKAIELLEKHEALLNYQHAKQCALITVDEIIELIEFNKYDDKYWEEEKYWSEVKQEINKL